MPEPPPTTDSPDSKDAELARLEAQNTEQAKQIAELLQRIRELETRLAKDSHNSSKPVVGPAVQEAASALAP